MRGRGDDSFKLAGCQLGRGTDKPGRGIQVHPTYMGLSSVRVDVLGIC